MNAIILFSMVAAYAGLVVVIARVAGFNDFTGE